MDNQIQSRLDVPGRKPFIKTTYCKGVFLCCRELMN